MTADMKRPRPAGEPGEAMKNEVHGDRIPDRSDSIRPDAEESADAESAVSPAVARPEIDIEAAAHFLKLLDPNEPAHWFRTFDDDKSRRNPALAGSRFGTLDRWAEYLRQASNAGCGVFVTVNETDGRDCKTANITRIRAVWQDDDAGWTGTFPLEPNFVVETSPGKYQRYWLTDGVTKDQFGTLMQVMVARYGSDPNCRDVARVLRLPGFIHQKNPSAPFLVRIVRENGRPPYSADEVLAAFLPDNPNAVESTPTRAPAHAPTRTREEKDSDAVAQNLDRVKDHARRVAERTMANQKVGRHNEIVKAFQYMRRDGIVIDQESVNVFYDTLDPIIRPTDTSGKVCGINREHETAALFWLPSVPDWPGSRHDDRAGFSNLPARRCAGEGGAPAKEGVGDGERDDTSLVEALIEGLSSEADRQAAREIRAALEFVRPDASIGGDANRRPTNAVRAIGYALSSEFGASVPELGRALAAEWDSKTGKNAAAVYDRADPNFKARGVPLGKPSIFALAKENGWPGMAASANSANSSASANSANASDGAQPEEIDTITPPPKPDDAMFYGLVGDVARAASAGTEANPVAAALAFLSFLGSQIGRDVYTRVGNTWHHPRLFTLQVGRSGRGRKGDSVALVHRIRRRAEETWAGTFGNTHLGGLSTREGLALLIHDGYDEGKNKVEPIADKRLWVVENEFANILHQSKRDGNTLSAALRDAWDGVCIRPAIKSCRVWASRPHVGLHCAITPSELLSLLESRELTNGFANRFLIVHAERTGLVAFPNPTPWAVVDELARRTGEVVAFAKGRYPDETDTREVTLSDDARVLYERAYKRELNRPEASETLTGLLERRAPYALRLAMLFALTDKSLTVEAHHLQAALAWVGYVRDSVRFIFGEQAGVAEAQEASEVASKILKFVEERGEPVTRTDIVVTCLQKKVSAAKIDAAIKNMLLANPPRIEQIKIPRADGKHGKPTTAYRISNFAREISENRENRCAARVTAESELSEYGELSFADFAQPISPNDSPDLTSLTSLNSEIDAGRADSLISPNSLISDSDEENGGMIEVTL